MDSKLSLIKDISIGESESASCDSADIFLITYFTPMSSPINEKLKLDIHIPLPGS